MRQNENLSQAISLVTNGHLFLEVSWSPCANQHLLHVCKVKTHNGTNLTWWDPERSSEALYAIVVYYTARAKQLCQIFCRSSTSLTPVTQDHLYSINPIQAQEISCNATQFEKFNFIKHAVVSRYFPPAERKAKNKIIKGSRKSLNKSRIRSHGFVLLTISR